MVFASSGSKDPYQSPREIMVARLNAQGKKLPGYPKTISSDGLEKSNPAVAAYKDGYIVAYSVGGVREKGQGGRTVITQLDSNGTPDKFQELDAAHSFFF